MSVLKWFGGVRMFMGFLIAPALVPICFLVLIAVIVHTRDIDCPAGLVMFVQGIPVAVVVWYVCVIGLSLPYVLQMRSRGELSLRTIMAPVLRLACPLAVLLFGIGAMAGLLFGAIIAVAWLPGIILSTLCFYFIAVWQPSGSAQKGF